MQTWQRVHLCTGLLIRDDRILLVASRYKNHEQPVWNLPGGRQEADESIARALQREFLEETGLAVSVGPLRYVSESFDRTRMTHFTNFAFAADATGEPHVPPGDRHVVDCAWVRTADVAGRLTVRVVREPLCAVLGGSTQTYFGYADAGVTIEFND